MLKLNDATRCMLQMDLQFVQDPAVIRYVRDMMNARLALLEYQKEEKVSEKPKFQHTFMEPCPLSKTFGKSLMETFGINSAELVDLLTKQQVSYTQARLEHEHERGLERARSHGLLAGDYVELKGVTPAMYGNGFYNGQQFRVIRRHRDRSDTHVIAQSREIGNFASINVAHLKRIHPSITF